MKRKNPSAVQLGKLRARKGPSLKEIGRIGGLKRAERLAEDGGQAFEAGVQRKGGLSGGKARAAKLTPEQRKEIAKKAAAARWGKRKPKS